MPNIRIREIDKSKNQRFFKNEIGVVVIDTNAASGDTPVKLTPSTSSISDFSKKALGLGATVYAVKSYADAKEYLKDRNQFDIKFLLLDENTISKSLTVSENTIAGEETIVGAEVQTETSELTSIIEIVSARKDCMCVLNAKDPVLQEATIKALSGELSYVSDPFYTPEGASRGNKVGKYFLAYYGKELKPTIKANEAFVLAYLNSLINGSASGLAVAGVVRGVVPGAESAGLITEANLESMQSRTSGISVNPICNVNPWGVRIWGNRTCLLNTENDLSYLSFANIRIAISDIKKALYKASRRNQFEQNSDILWVNFSSEIKSLLDDMVQNYVIASYKIKRQPSEGQRAKLKALINIIPVEAVEDFDLTIELNDELDVAE